MGMALFGGGTFINFEEFHIFLLHKGSFVLELMNCSISSEFIQGGTFINFCEFFRGYVYLEGYVYFEV